MARAFPLAGLLRLRHLQQDQAAGELAAANSDLQETSVSRERARVALGATSTDTRSVEGLYAVAAARAATRGMLADLDTLGRRHEAAAQHAQAAFDAARARALSLEKLEGRHEKTVATEEQHDEQLVIDEIASTSWHRDRGEAAR
jgi:flagellar protein FliJ